MNSTDFPPRTRALAERVRAALGESAAQAPSLILERIGDALREDPKGRAFLGHVVRCSMLDEEVVLALIGEAATGEGPVLEVGGFIGGSSLALRLGCAISGRSFRSIELGGARTDHEDPRFFVKDIHAVWTRNVARYFPDARQVLIKGGYDDPHVREAVAGWLGGRKLGLLFVDADGHLDRTIGALAGHLQAGTRLVIDDYLTPVAKQGLVKSVVDAHCSAGYWRADEDAIIGEGTWRGVCEPSITRIAGGQERIVRLLEPGEAGIEPPGHAVALAGAICGPGDDFDDPQRSHLVVLEDGVPLGPPHTPAEAIERTGAGAYAHWRRTLYFSASDGTDPLANGRNYRVRTREGEEVGFVFCRAVRLDPARPAVAGLEGEQGEAAGEPFRAPDWPRWLRPAVRRTRLLFPARLRTWLRAIFLRG